MAELKTVLAEAGFSNVVTYLQSGDVIFSSGITNTIELANRIHEVIIEMLGLDVDVIVFSKSEWASIIRKAPVWWGSNKEWKHNLLVLLKPFDIDEAIRAIGELKPNIEAAEPGNGVIYQSMSLKFFSRTTTGKLSSGPIYKRITVRNYNTATKLLTILD